MYTVGKFVFLLTFFFLKTQAQVTPKLVDPNAYVGAVIDELWKRIKEHGISNLPVADVSVNFNTNPLGFELNGPASFEDGFVQDIESVTMDDRVFIHSLDLSLITLGTNIVFTNIKMYRDLRAELTTGTKVGTVVSTSQTLAYSLRLFKGYTNDTVVTTLAFSSQGGFVWDIHPDDMTTRLIRREYSRLHTPGPDFIISTSEAWRPLFLRFLNEIVESIDFPELTF